MGGVIVCGLEGFGVSPLSVFVQGAYETPKRPALGILNSQAYAHTIGALI